MTARDELTMHYGSESEHWNRLLDAYRAEVLREASTLTAPAPQPTVPAPVRTDAAADWTARCGRATTLASYLIVEFGARQDVTDITADADRVCIGVTPTTIAEWEAWTTRFGVHRDALKSIGFAMVGTGSVDGVPVRLVGSGVPHMLTTALRTTPTPRELSAELMRDIASRTPGSAE